MKIALLPGLCVADVVGSKRLDGLYLDKPVREDTSSLSSLLTHEGEYGARSQRLIWNRKHSGDTDNGAKIDCSTTTDVKGRGASLGSAC